MFSPSVNPGSNHIVRKSGESAVTVPDVPSTLTLSDLAEGAISTGNTEELQHQSATGLPNRLLLPKGNYAGVEYKLVVMVSDALKDFGDNFGIVDSPYFHHYGTHGHYYDKMPHGFPLDRSVPDDTIFHELPNIEETLAKVFDYDEHIKPYH